MLADRLFTTERGSENAGKRWYSLIAANRSVEVELLRLIFLLINAAIMIVLTAIAAPATEPYISPKAVIPNKANMSFSVGMSVPCVSR